MVDEIERSTGRTVTVIDASTAHRTADGWVYGFPELAAAQAPGRARSLARFQPWLLCHGRHRTAALPLVDAGLIPPTTL